jgi:hypothetical protein
MYRQSAPILQNSHRWSWCEPVLGSKAFEPLFRLAAGCQRVFNRKHHEEPAFGVSQPTAVPRPVTAGGGPNLPRAYDVAPDGQHLVILTPPDTANSVSVGPQVQVVLNWFEELKARVPVK